MESKKTFEQLVSESISTGDKRKKIFSELHQYIENDMLPLVAKCLEAAGESELLIFSDIPLFTKMDGYLCLAEEDVDEEGFCYQINLDCTLTELILKRTFDSDQWEESLSKYDIPFSKCVIPRKRLAVFALKVRRAIERLNGRMNYDIKIAEEILNDK